MSLETLWQMVPAAAEGAAGHLWSVSWQVSVLVVIVALASLCCRRLAPRIRYWLWWIVLVRLLVPAGLESPIGIFESGGVVSPVAGSAAVEAPRNGADGAGAARRVTPGAAYRAAASPVEVPAADIGQGSRRLSPAAGLALVWGAGALLLGLLVVARARRLRLRLVAGSRPASSETQGMLRRLQREIGLEAVVELAVCDPETGVTRPAVFGIRRPKILLPAAMVESWSVAELEPVLVHELTHVRRRDPWWNAAQLVLQALYFFHPLVWWVNHRIRAERELVCDDEVVSHYGGRPRIYAASLLRFAELLRTSGRQPVLGPAIAESKSALATRIERILRRDPGRFRGARAMVILLGVVSIGLAADGQRPTSSAIEPDPAEPEAEERGEAESRGTVHPVSANRIQSQVTVPRGFVTSDLGQVGPATELELGGDVRRGRIRRKGDLGAIPPEVEGRVEISALVDAEGRVRRAEVTRALDPVTDAVLLRYVEGQEWQPSVHKEGWPLILEVDFEFEIQRAGWRPKPTPEPDDDWDWQTPFLAAYRLQPGQNLAIIPWPADGSRQAFVRSRGGLPAANRHMPDRLVFFVEGETLDLNPPLTQSNFFGPTTLGSLLPIFDLPDYAVIGDRDLLEAEVEGDLMIRQGTDTAVLLQELAILLRTRLQVPIALHLSTVMHRTLVVRGRFGDVPADPHFGRPTLHIFTDERNTSPSVGAGGLLNADGLAEFLAMNLNHPVVGEIDEPPEKRILARFHDSSYRTRYLDLVVENLERQSDLEFTFEDRPIDILHLERSPLDPAEQREIRAQAATAPQ